MKPGEIFVHPNGKTYEAVKGDICNECAFVQNDSECTDAPPCTLGTNGIQLIFKEVKPKTETNDTQGSD